MPQKHFFKFPLNHLHWILSARMKACTGAELTTAILQRETSSSISRSWVSFCIKHSAQFERKEVKSPFPVWRICQEQYFLEDFSGSKKKRAKLSCIIQPNFYADLATHILLFASLIFQTPSDTRVKFCKVPCIDVAQFRKDTTFVKLKVQMFHF